MTGSGWGANNRIYYNKLSKMSSFQQKITRHTNRKPIQQGEKKKAKETIHESNQLSDYTDF